MTIAAIVEAQKREWEELVTVALATPEEHSASVAAEIATATNVGVDSLKRKFGAIQHQATLGYTSDEIIRAGQEKVLGAFIKSRKVANYQAQVMMKWMVPGSQRELVQIEERRVRALLKLNTAIEFWDWWIAMIHNATDQDIIDSAKENEEDES